jgi:hypothetical protein
MANAPHLDETGEALRVICPTTKAEFISASDWTGQINLIRHDKLVFWRKSKRLSGRRRARLPLMTQSGSQRILPSV